MSRRLGGANKIDGVKDLAATAASLLDEGKGVNVTVLSVGDMTTIADYFVIASGATERQVKALTDRVLLGLNHKRKPSHIEGYETGSWVLMDYGDVIVHVFREQERAFYGLERLWGDAPRLEWEPSAQVT